MYIYKYEQFINGHAIANLGSLYDSIDGNTYCEGCVVEHYVELISKQLWFRKSTRKNFKADRVYRLEDGRYHRVSSKEFLSIPDWNLRFVKSRIQNF